MDAFDKKAYLRALWEHSLEHWWKALYRDLASGYSVYHPTIAAHVEGIERASRRVLMYTRQDRGS